MNEVKSLEECRACLRKINDGVRQELFRPWHTTWAISGALIADDLAKLADIEISDADKHSKVICPKCFHHLADACSFLVTVQESDFILRKRFENTTTEGKETESSSWPQPILVNKNLNENSIEVEIKQEVLSEDEYGSNQMDHDWEPTMDIKIEPEEFVAPVPSNIQVNGAYSLKESNEEAIHQNGTSDYCEEEYLDNTIKEEPLSDGEHEVAADLPLDCMLCMKTFNSVTGLKAHVIAQHSYGTVKRKTDNCQSPVNKENTNEFVCATCRESFKTRTDLMVHETTHGKHACFVCDAKFNTFRQLSRHGARCRPRTAPRGGPAMPRTRSQSKNHSSAVEVVEELVQKQSKIRIKSIEELKVTPEQKMPKGGPSFVDTEEKPAQKQSTITDQTKVNHVRDQTKLGPSTVEIEPIQKQSNIGPSTEQTKETPEQKEPKIEPSIEEIKVELAQKESNNGTSFDETKVEPVQKQSKIEPSIEETKIELVETEFKTECSTEERTDEPSTEESEIEPSMEESKNEPSTEENKIKHSTEESKVEPSTKEIKVEHSTKKRKVEPSTEEIMIEYSTEASKVEHSTKKRKVEPSTEEIIIEPSTEESKVELSSEESKVESSTKKRKVEPTSEESNMEPLTNESKVEPSTEESKEEPSTEEIIIEPSSEESKVKLSSENRKVETSTKKRKAEPTFEESKMESLTNESKVEPSTEESKDEPSTEESKVEPSSKETVIELLEETHSRPKKFINIKDQLKPATKGPAPISSSPLQYTILYEDESSDPDTKMTEKVEETTSQHNSSDSPQSSQDNSDEISVNTPCNEQVPIETNNQLTTQGIERELHHEELSDQENVPSNPQHEGYSHTPKENIANPDGINQSMKVHLAINPLSEDPVLLENKMDIDLEREKSSDCEPKVNMKSEISDNSVIQ